MAVSVAEYLGQRTDSDIQIEPCDVPYLTLASIPLCPFNDTPCSKINKKTNAKHPVCSLRKPDGTFYIVCEDRLLSGSTRQISEYQKETLLQAAKVLFHPTINSHQVGYKSEVSIQTGKSKNHKHRADFILSVVDEALHIIGPRQMLVEVQGGGETNNTDKISSHIRQWASNSQDNAFLRQSVSGAGTIETNAWRRFQEQLFVKATTAKKTDRGFAVLMGEVVFNYVVRMIPDIQEIQMGRQITGWDTVFVVYKEKPLGEVGNLNTPVELEVDSERTIYTQLDKLFLKLLSRGHISPKAFAGEYRTLTGETVTFREDGSIQLFED